MQMITGHKCNATYMYTHVPHIAWLACPLNPPYLCLAKQGMGIGTGITLAPLTYVPQHRHLKRQALIFIDMSLSLLYSVYYIGWPKKMERHTSHNVDAITDISR